jgi:putative nucleotidyltransferase with HDIG domain
LQGDRSAKKDIKKLAWIIERCDNLDDACEMEARVGSDADLTCLDETITAVEQYLRTTTEDELDLAAQKVPVFPAVAQEAFGLLGSDKTNVSELEKIIRSDQTLAGHIVAAANSARIAGRRRVAALREAVTRIGFALARDVVCACALRRMYGARHSHSLWNHSLEVAETARMLAEQGGRADPEQAFLAGLVHDIGKLVVLSLPRKAIESYDRLSRKGCPDVIVERVVFGLGHPVIGARLLRRWKFDERIVLAVENHHEPEKDASGLCAVVYLAERAARRDEGLESVWRDELARHHSGFPGPLELVHVSSVFNGLRFDT